MNTTTTLERAQAGECAGCADEIAGIDGPCIEKHEATRRPIPLDEKTIRRLIRRIVERRFEWGLGSLRGAKGEHFDDVRRRLERAAALAIFEFDFRDGWNRIPDGPYHVFGPPQKMKLARDVPASVVHEIMCKMKND